MKEFLQGTHLVVGRQMGGGGGGVLQTQAWTSTQKLALTKISNAPLIF